MKSIARPITSNQSIHKSLFLCHLIPVKSESHAMKKYWEIKEEYPDATHHCFAYVVGDAQNHQKYSDDGEPTRTAGYPMLDVLLKQDLTNVLAVTVRYYGGTQLGAGGLVRAYSGSVAETLKQARYTYLNQFLIVQIHIPFDEIGKVEHFLRSDYTLVHTFYDDGVTYTIEIEEDKFKKLQTFLANQTNGKSICDIKQRIRRYI